MNRKAYEKALKHLKDKERQALVLVKANGKSSWEAGEIIETAHYKFLEILSRGKKFVELYTEHFTLYDQLIPEEITISPTIKNYLNYVMGSARLKPSEARAKMSDPFFNSSNNQAKLFEFEFAKWSASKNLHERYFMYFVKEFDRWNNYRILPLAVQEPHAFKRRNKRRYEYMISNGWRKTLKEVKQYKAKYGAHGKTTKANTLYMVLFEDFKRGLYHYIAVDKREKDIIAELSRKKHYLFSSEDKKILEELTFECLELLSLDYRTPTQGLRFWNNFREKISKAYNYNECEGINKDRPILETKNKGQVIRFQTH